MDVTEESAVWRSVQTDGYRSIAKLRVYCDPIYAGLLRAVLTRERFETTVAEAIAAALA